VQEKDCGIMTEKKKIEKRLTKKSLVATAALAALLFGQTAVNASTITDASGNALPTGGDGQYYITPDAFFNGVGYRKFQDMNLSQGDILNFLFKYYNYSYPNSVGDGESIDRFVNLVKNQIELNGIVNAVSSTGTFKPNGQLVFISPNGMVVGSSGVLNVGSLSVLTPTMTEFNSMYNNSGIPDSSTYYPSVNGASQASTVVTQANELSSPVITFGNNGQILKADGTAFTTGVPEAYNDNGVARTSTPSVTINNGGGIVARGDVNIQSGTLTNNGGILAGVTTADDYGTKWNNTNASTLFNALVNTSDMTYYSGSNGNITVNTNNGITTGDTSKIYNYNSSLTNGDGNLTMNNTGGNGIVLGGKVYNQNGVMTVNNTSATGRLETTAGSDIYNNGTMNFSNSGSGGMDIKGAVTNNTGAATFTNTAGGMVVSAGGNITSNGTSLAMNNSGAGGMTITGTVNNTNGTATLTNSNGGLTINNTLNSTTNRGVVNSGTSLTINNEATATDDLNIAGNVTNTNGALVINNKGNQNALKVGGKVLNSGSSLTMTNDGADGFTVNGMIENQAGPAILTNNAGSFTVGSTGEVKNSGASLKITNNGTGNLSVLNGGKIRNSNGTVEVINTDGGNFIVGGQIIGDTNSTSMTLKNLNTSGEMAIDSTGSVNNVNTLLVQNDGVAGLNIEGSITNDGNATINNTGAAGFNLESSGRINNKGHLLTMYNDGADGMNIKGLVTTTDAGNIQITNQNSNVTIGDNTDNNNYITSNGNVNIDIQDGNLFNYGVAKTLIVTNNLNNASNNLTIDVNNGAIGQELTPCDGGICTGIGVDQRDLTKSINTNIKGKINADSTAKAGAVKPTDFTDKSQYNGYSVINMASLDQDMHVDRIRSDGRVILLADNADLNQKGVGAYSVVNASGNNTTTNVEGAGISIIAGGNIGENNNKLTFRQTGASVEIAHDEDANGNVVPNPNNTHTLVLNNNSEYGVDMLSFHGDINIKGMDSDTIDPATGKGVKLDTNVCSIVAREGNINAEFSGNTAIRDITAPGEINVVNRGRDLYIQNLGGNPELYEQPGDYYGGYDANNPIAPTKVTLKALNLNPDQYNGQDYADSTIVVKNGTINGQGSISHPGMDQDVTVTADNAYIGGYYFNMGPHRGTNADGTLKLSSVTPDGNTNPLGSTNDATPSIRGRAVRPEDVTAIGREEEERNYYYGQPTDEEIDRGHRPGTGSGQSDYDTFDPNVEDGDDLVVPTQTTHAPPPPPPSDPTPTTPTVPTPPPPPGPDPTPTPTIPTVPTDAVLNFKQRVVSDQIDAIDKRQAMRFDIAGNPNNVSFQSSRDVKGILDISRSGVSLSHDGNLNVGDVVPIELTYGDVNIKTNVKIVSKTNTRAGGQFVDLDDVTAKKILYLSMLDGSDGMVAQFGDTTRAVANPSRVTATDGLLNVSFTGD
jgi:hypothetical protein